MDLMDKRKQQLKIQSAADMIKQGVSVVLNPSLYVHGPKHIDGLTKRWCRGDGLGLIGSSGIGKTSFILYLFKEMLKNSPEGICVFVALEMSKGELIDKWKKVSEDCPEISERFFIITNFHEDGKAKSMSIRDIKKELETHKAALGQTLISYVVDHLHIVKREEGETLDDVVYSWSSMNKELDTFGILNSQTTKTKSGSGDIPLDKTACYGCSAFEWESTYIITISQPLKRVQNEIDLPVTAWQYAKIRFKDRSDKFKESVNYLLYYNYESDSYRELTIDELHTFKMWYDRVIEMRDAEEKKKAYVYDTSYTIKGPNGDVKMPSTTGGIDL